jgi:hypothetical protein
MDRPRKTIEEKPMHSRRPQRFIVYSLLAAFVLSLSGCGGGSSSGALSSTNACSGKSTPDDCSQLYVGVTDAEGDFVNYEVGVNSLRLERADGSSVDLLPNATRIDFAQMTDLTEIVSAAFLPPGVYIGGSIEVDFSTADVHVEGTDGQMLPARVVGANGNPLGVVSLEIKLDSQHQLLLTRRRAAMLTIDFDLAASNVVDTSTNPAVVTAAPYIVAEAAPVEQKDLRVRGALTNVDTVASTYTVEVRPWHRPSGDFGQVTVHTTPDTSYEIDDQIFSGDAGLQALSGADPGTLTVAFGAFDLQSREFTADIVQAGDNVAGIDIDAVEGHVVARSADELLVKGAYLVRPGHDARFQRTVRVNVDAMTRVTKIGSTSTLDAQAISVGQRIVAFGNLSDPGVAADPASVPVLDATHVRLLATQLRGTVLSTTPGQLDMSVRAIGPLNVSQFDFSGTGMSTAVDADPNDYEIATGSVPLDAFTSGENAKVLGFVTPFGAAPPDFEGRTLIEHRNLPALLGVGWGTAGTAAPFLSLEPTGLALNLTNLDIGERHHLMIGFDRIDITTLGSLSLVPPSAERALYGLWEPGHVELFNDFSAFVAEVTNRIESGARARALYASGRYDEAAHALETRRVSLQMLPAVQ